MSENENKIVINLRKTDYDVPYTMQQCDDNVKKYTFLLKGDVYQALETEAYFKTKSRFNVVGFRKGKAPMHIIKSMYGAYAFLEEAIDTAVDACYRPFYQDIMSGLRVAASPDLEYGKCDHEQIEFTFVIIEYPTLDNLTYKDIEVERVLPREITDEMVEDKLNKAREKAGYWQDITDRPAEMGDTTNINYAGSIDGEFFAGGTADEQELTLGSHKFIDGFEDQIVGMNIDEERDIKVTFPSDYGAEELAGKEAVFHVKLNSLKVKVLPEADDEFAKDVSDFDTLAELKDSYRKELAEQEESRAKNGTEHNLLAAVVAANEVSINAKIIDEAAENKVNDFEKMLSGNGMTLEDYCNYTGVTREKMVEDYHQSCLEQEKRSLVLTEIVKAEGLTVSPEEMDARIQKDAEAVGKDVETYKQEMKREDFDYLYNSMLSDKLVDYLLSVNKLVDPKEEPKAE
ncbi:MAG: trigger factor [Clostridia bacterium]|nr:trigger factor [Clostridia bacterium]